jgi:glycosyltransferase involved in cell wall biosynthesis
LVREFAAANFSTVIMTDDRCDSDPVEGALIRKVFDPDEPSSNWKLVEAIVAEQPDWILLQYNPFGFGRRGLNLHLYRVLAAMKKKLPQSRLAIMFHETYVPWSGVRMSIMAVWQRWQFKRLGRAADVMFFSISPWADEHRAWFPGKPIYHLPVGSNIPRVEITKTEARRRLDIDEEEVVLGVFGNAHTSRLFGMVRAAAEAVQRSGRRVRVLYIGPDGKTILKSLGDVPAITDGPLPGDEVSRRLSAVDISLATYSDGVSTRRGAMMAALQHGLPIVGTIGIHTDPELAAEIGTAMLLIPAHDVKGYAEAVVALSADTAMRDRLSRGAVELFERRYCWAVIAENLINVLAASKMT